MENQTQNASEDARPDVACSAGLGRGEDEWLMQCALCGERTPWSHYPVRHDATCARCCTVRDTHAEFEVRGWRNRLRVLLTGRVGTVFAARAPVVVRQGKNYTSLDAGALDTLPELRYLPRPSLVADWAPPQAA